MRVPLVAALAFAAAASAAAQSTPGAATGPAVLDGRVTDSLVTGLPLGRAELILDGKMTGVLTDASGRYHFADVGPGRHTLGFYHPTLDSLDVASPLATFDAQTGANLVNLATPSAATFHRIACGVAPGEAEGAVVGIVYDAQDERPVGGAAVAAAWVEWTFAHGAMQRVQRGTQVNSDVDGRYILCGVPADVVVELSARGGTRASGAVDIAMGARAFGVRRIAIGAPSGAVVAGTVRDTLGRPVANARVQVARTTAETTTDSAGAFRIGDAPAGSNTIEVKAVGYQPTRVPAQTKVGSPAQVVVTVGRAQVLPTIAVVGKRGPRADLTGFDERSKRGFGHFVTQADIEKRHPMHISESLRTVPGVRLMPGRDGRSAITILGGGSGGSCIPNMFVDGNPVWQGATMIDDFMPPDVIRGVEVYTSSATVPVEYRTANSTCGAVLIWTRLR